MITHGCADRSKVRRSTNLHKGDGAGENPMRLSGGLQSDETGGIPVLDLGGTGFVGVPPWSVPTQLPTLFDGDEAGGIGRSAEVRERKA